MYTMAKMARTCLFLIDLLVKLQQPSNEEVLALSDLVFILRYIRRRPSRYVRGFHLIHNETQRSSKCIGVSNDEDALPITSFYLTGYPQSITEFHKRNTTMYVAINKSAMYHNTHKIYIFLIIWQKSHNNSMIDGVY